MDLENYLSNTRELIRQAQYEEALQRCLWFHDHALEHQESMHGVRLSYALADWLALGHVYPPAMTALKKKRDNKLTIMKAGQGDARLFSDVVGLNQILGDESKTIELFRLMDDEQSALATQCWHYVRRTVFQAKAYDLAHQYCDHPLVDFDKMKALYDRQMAHVDENQIEQRIRTSIEQCYVEEFVILIQWALGLNDQSAAKEIQRKALAFLDDDRLVHAIV